MKKVTLLLLTLIMVSVPMHLLTAQPADQNGMAMNPDMMMMYLIGADTGDMSDPDADGGMMGDDMMGGGMMGGGMMGGGMDGSMMCSRMMDGMMGHGGMMAHGGMHSGMMMGLRAYAMFIQIRNALNITPDQLSRIQTTILDHIRTVAPIDANIKVAKAETLTMLMPLLDVQGPAIDINGIDTRLHNIKKLEADKELSAVRTIANLKGILTKEQLQRLQTFMLDMVNKMHGGKKMMPGMPGNQQPQQQPPQQGSNQ